jgi:predicted DNA binding protein
MSVVAEFTVPTGSFPLGQALGEFSDRVVELERVVPTTDALLPFFWVWGDGAERFAETITDRGAVRDVELLDVVNGGALFRARWRADVHGVLRGLVESELVLLESSGTGDSWFLRVRADDRSAVAAFRTYCDDHGIPVELTRLTDLPDLPGYNEFGLTEGQREVLLLAYERGYFDEPREASLEDLASVLGVSRQAVAARLRRAHRNLVGNTLARD